MCETEAHGIAFEIDHYEPKRGAPHLENDYDNLMYACQPCNNLKGDRCPPSEARAEGHRFFRPDQDIYDDHFQLKDRRLDSETNVGKFSIEYLDLNRLGLRRLREIRERLLNTAPIVAEDIFELRKFKIDQLPQNVKGLALLAIRRMEEAHDKISKDIDALLRDFARSALLGPDPDAETRAKDRAEKARQLRRLFPGAWQAREK